MDYEFKDWKGSSFPEKLIDGSCTWAYMSTMQERPMALLYDLIRNSPRSRQHTRELLNRQQRGSKKPCDRFRWAQRYPFSLNVVYATSAFIVP